MQIFRSSDGCSLSSCDVLVRRLQARQLQAQQMERQRHQQQQGLLALEAGGVVDQRQHHQQPGGDILGSAGAGVGDMSSVFDSQQQYTLQLQRKQQQKQKQQQQQQQQQRRQEYLNQPPLAAVLGVGNDSDIFGTLAQHTAETPAAGGAGAVGGDFRTPSMADFGRAGGGIDFAGGVPGLGGGGADGLSGLSGVDVGGLGDLMGSSGVGFGGGGLESGSALAAGVSAGGLSMPSQAVEQARRAALQQQQRQHQQEAAPVFFQQPVSCLWCGVS